MGEGTLRGKESGLVRLTRVPKDGKRIGPPGRYEYSCPSEAPDVFVEPKSRRGANAYLLSNRVFHLKDNTVSYDIQYYSIPKKRVSR